MDLDRENIEDYMRNEEFIPKVHSAIEFNLK
jgi:hypothetical protein